MDKVWQIFKQDAPLAANLAHELKISSLTAQVLINRGIHDLREAQAFLKPSLADLRNPMEIPNIEKAAKRVLLAKERGEKVCVYGDYDVDGVTGTAILVNTLKLLGLDTIYYIPHRYGEGYSLSDASVAEIAKMGVKLIVTVDCGISNFKEIEEAKRLGLEVVVTDHHNLPEKLPNAYAIVNPKQIKGDHPSKYLAGAGVAFKFAWALLRVAGVKDSVFLTALLDLAALGTISDVVPLTAENRILAVMGLKYINERKRPGIKALAEVASLYKNIAVNQIYFGLAPRINAAGRLEHASKSVDLLLTEDANEAQALAEELDEINVRRRGIGEEIRDDVFSNINDQYVAENKVVVISGENWHPGVIGIVASRVVDAYFRPAVLISVNEGVGRGSARSLAGINVYELLNACKDLFIDFGGHEGAAGFEIKPENIPELKKRLKTESDRLIRLEDMKPKVVVDSVLDPAQITMSLVRELDILDPHGEGNPKPIFMSSGLKLADVRTVGKKGAHLKVKFAVGETSLEAIGFRMGDLSDKLSYNTNYDIAYRLEANEWDGFEVAQLNLVDIRES
ncbi:MAG: single-stranded-DNA-specific exonuclease RecJ [bacterium]